MLFEFLKYISPTWYFNLMPADQSVPYFVDYRKLSKEEQGLLDIDDRYRTLQGKLADAAYQAWQKGIIKNEFRYSLFNSTQFHNSGKYKDIKLFEGQIVRMISYVFVRDIQDNYHFIRRFFNPAIGWYILLVRLLSLHNPARDLTGFLRSMKVKRVDLKKENSWLILKDEYHSFESALVKQKPKVTVVIPTLNRYKYLKDVLSDLEKQDYGSFEVIVCDQSDIYDMNFYKDWHLDLKIIRQEEKALWLARNTSIRKAAGEYILLFDDDSRIKPDWITQHLKCLDYFKVDISSGVSLSVVGGKIPENYSFFRWSDQIDTGNVMFRKDMMRLTGMFDRQFEGQRQGDGEFGLRCYLLGLHNVSNPLAGRIHLKVAEGGLRQMGSWDGLRPKKFFAPRPVPSVLYLSRKYFGDHLSGLMLLFSIPGSIVPYRYKGTKWRRILAFCSLVVIWPFLLFQVIKAWRLSGIKLIEGSLIETP